MTDHDTPAADRDSMAARRGQDGEIADLTLACTLFEQVVMDRDARIAQLETQLGQAYTDIAAHEERETDLQVELSKAREERTDLRGALDAALAELEQWRAAAAILQQGQHDLLTEKEARLDALRRIGQYQDLAIERGEMIIALITELGAARQVVMIARRGFGTNADIGRAEAFDPTALTRAIERYDEATKAAPS